MISESWRLPPLIDGHPVHLDLWYIYKYNLIDWHLINQFQNQLAYSERANQVLKLVGQTHKSTIMYTNKHSRRREGEGGREGRGGGRGGGRKGRERGR